MRDSAKGWKQGRKPAQADKEYWLTATQVAKLNHVSARAVRDGCTAGLYPGARKARINGGEGWQIPLACLPASIQIDWHERQRNNRQEKIQPSRTSDRDTVSPNDTATPATDQIYRDGLWEAFWKGNVTQAQRDEAARRVEVLREYDRLHGIGISRHEILADLKDRFGITRTTFWRYEKMVKGRDPSLWAPLLLPARKGNTRRAEFTEEAWGWIQDQYLIQSQPPLSLIYERAQRMAQEKGWVIPSYDAVNDRIKALPHNYVVAKREGKRGLDRTFAFQERDYSALDLHEIWNSDGHKADVFVKDESGNVFRPIVVAWQELRSRKLLGWAIGRSETSELVRRALHRSITACGNVVPRYALMDNGMAFAAKENTGGAPTRNRFKLKENEILGTLTLLGIESIWATPGAGRSKPIEPFWRHVTKMVRTKEFEGAYCGNKPGARPENFTEKNAVPLAVFERHLEETFRHYNASAHRGNSMRGKSPTMVYEELLQFTTVRTVTNEQLRGCMLSAIAVTLDRNNGAFFIHGNRYWSTECSALPQAKGYWARYDGDNLPAGASLYLNGVFKLDVPLYEKSGFNDKNAANERRKVKRAYDKSVKQLDLAREKLLEADSPDFRLAEETPDPAAPSATRPKIVKPIRSRLQIPLVPKQVEEEDDTPLLSAAEIAGLLAKKLCQQNR